MKSTETAPIKILYADDDRDDRELFADALAIYDSNTRLILVEDGKELLDYLSNITDIFPDIIFLDINMPCFCGKQCLREIRRNPIFNDVPVVMFSTSALPVDIEETFSNGANLYVRKPSSFDGHVSIFESIFEGDWQQELLSTAKERYLLLT